jgi:hypothetical protein
MTEAQDNQSYAEIELKAEVPALEVQSKKPRPRNYSFKHRNPDTLGTARFGGDDNPDKNAPTFSIPAHIGSVFWAILKVCYENANQRVYTDDLLTAVDSLMRERDESRWNYYINKAQTTISRRRSGTPERSVQKIKPWGERVINNGKTLTRKGGASPYGARLIEQGHSLKYGTDENMKPYFILFTSIEAATKVVNG